MFVCKFCNIFSSFTTFIEIVCSITLYCLISYLIVVSKNSITYLFLHSSNLFAFDFLIVVIIVEVLFIYFDVVYTIDFFIALLILLRVFIELSFVYFSTIKRLSLIFVFKIV